MRIRVPEAQPNLARQCSRAPLASRGAALVYGVAEASRGEDDRIGPFLQALKYEGAGDYGVDETLVAIEAQIPDVQRAMLPMRRPEPVAVMHLSGGQRDRRRRAGCNIVHGVEQAESRVLHDIGETVAQRVGRSLWPKRTAERRDKGQFHALVLPEAENLAKFFAAA
jgi:hypothetical protein